MEKNLIRNAEVKIEELSWLSQPASSLIQGCNGPEMEPFGKKNTHGVD